MMVLASENLFARSGHYPGCCDDLFVSDGDGVCVGRPGSFLYPGPLSGGLNGLGLSLPVLGAGRGRGGFCGLSFSGMVTPERLYGINTRPAI